MNFEIFIQDVVRRLEEDIQTKNIFTSNVSSTDLEKIIVQYVEKTAINKNIDLNIDYVENSHRFPDIVLTFSGGKKYGIEVKSSVGTSSSWRTNGNSILSSISEPDLIDVWIIFGKTTLQQVKFARYEDAVINIGVTHSPRYLIDMDVKKEDNFFNKSKLTFKDLNNSDDPIGIIQEYFRNQQVEAWWISETKTVPIEIRIFSDLTNKKKQQYIVYGLAHFPEIFGQSGQKYKKFSLWMIKEKSVVTSNVRDSFSAGGQLTVKLDEREVLVPRVLEKIYKHRVELYNILKNEDPINFIDDWKLLTEIKTNEELIGKWIKLVAQNVNISDVTFIETQRIIKGLLMGTIKPD